MRHPGGWRRRGPMSALKGYRRKLPVLDGPPQMKRAGIAACPVLRPWWGAQNSCHSALDSAGVEAPLPRSPGRWFGTGARTRAGGWLARGLVGARVLQAEHSRELDQLLGLLLHRARRGRGLFQQRRGLLGGLVHLGDGLVDLPDTRSGGLRDLQATHQPAHVDDQRHPAITHDGGARNPVDAPIVVLDVLDHDLLLAQ